MSGTLRCKTADQAHEAVHPRVSLLSREPMSNIIDIGKLKGDRVSSLLRSLDERISLKHVHQRLQARCSGGWLRPHSHAHAPLRP